MDILAVKLRSSVRSDTGRVRRNNEDAYLYQPEIGLFAVADGMGGHAAGELASRMAMEELEAAAEDGIPDQLYLEERSLDGRQLLLDWLRHTVHAINFQLQAKAQEDEELRGMGCTLDVLLFRDRGVFLAHVGDSRSYILRREQLFQLTEDHNLEALMRASGEFAPEDIARHPQRSALTRALGPMPTVEVETAYFEVGPGDVFLMCSDGLHGELDDAFMAAQLEASPEVAVQELVDAALTAGGRDNITAVVVALSQARHATRADTQPSIVGSAMAYDALRGSPIFAAFTQWELARVQRVAVARSFEPGENPVVEGVVTDFFYMNLEGHYTIWRDGVKLGDGGPGDPMGEVSLVPSPSIVTVRAESPMITLLFRHEPLRALMAEEPVIGSKLATALLERVSQRVRSLVSILARYRRTYGPTP